MSCSRIPYPNVRRHADELPLRKDRQAELTTADIAQGTRAEDRETEIQDPDRVTQQQKQPVEITAGQPARGAARTSGDRTPFLGFECGRCLQHRERCRFGAAGLPSTRCTSGNSLDQSVSKLEGALRFSNGDARHRRRHVKKSFFVERRHELRAKPKEQGNGHGCVVAWRQKKGGEVLPLPHRVWQAFTAACPCRSAIPTVRSPEQQRSQSPSRS